MAAPDAKPFTYADLAGVDRRGGLRRTPELAAAALAMVWRASRSHLVGVTLLQVAAAGGAALQLLVAREILQELIAVGEGASVDILYGPFALLVAVLAAVGIVAALATYQQRLLVDIVAGSAFHDLLGLSGSVELGALERASFHDQLQRARESGQFRTVDVVTSVTSLAMALLTSLGIAIVLAVLEPLLLVFVAIAAVPALIASIHNSRASYVFEYGMTPESRERAYIVDLLTERAPAKEVRLFGLAAHLRDRFDTLTRERIRHLRRFLRTRLRVSLLGSVAGAVGAAIAFGALVVLLDRGRIGVAEALTAGIAMQQLSVRLNAITTNVGRLIESGMFLDDYRAFLGAAHAVARDDTDGAGARREPFRSLRVEEVTFTYPSAETPALVGASIEIGAGEVVALVGENGSGKTTLVKLVCRLYEPQEGRIVWNGVDASTLPAHAIRGETTVLFQDYVQYQLSARDNIALGRVERPPDDAGVVAAAVEAGADAFLERLPAGYDTRLGPQFYGGQELSVGQWQRLALARAFFRGGSLLVLDEPTAALDPRAERDLFDGIRRLFAGRAVLLISHRFSSVRTADRIYVLEHGRVTESGSHAELMRLDGHYAELFRIQAAAYLDEVREPR